MRPFLARMGSACFFAGRFANPPSFRTMPRALLMRSSNESAVDEEEEGAEDEGGMAVSGTWQCSLAAWVKKSSAHGATPCLDLPGCSFLFEDDWRTIWPKPMTSRLKAARRSKGTHRSSSARHCSAVIT